MEREDNDWRYIAPEIWAAILKQLRSPDLFKLRIVCSYLRDFVNGYMNNRQPGQPHIFESSSVEEIYLLLAATFGRETNYCLVDCATKKSELKDLTDNKTYFVSRNKTLLSKHEDWRTKVEEYVQKGSLSDPSLSLSHRTTLQALYALKIIKESQVITLNYKDRTFRISSKNGQVVIHTSYMPSATSNIKTDFQSFSAFIVAVTGRRGSIRMYNKLRIGSRSYQQVQREYQSNIQQRVSERLKQSEAIEFIITPRGEVEPSPTPLTLKDQVLNSFVTAGINEQLAEEYLTEWEEALPMDSTENWISASFASNTRQWTLVQVNSQVADG